MTTIGPFRFRMELSGNLGYKSKLYGTHPPCPQWLDLEGARGIDQSNKITEQIQNPSKFGTTNYVFSKKCKDQNDRIGKIYRFEKWLDPFSLTNRVKSRNWETNLVLSFPLIGQPELHDT